MGSGCCRGHAAPWEAKAMVMLPLHIPHPSLQAAVGLWHSLTHREKGGVGEHCVHVQVGLQLWTSPLWSIAAPISQVGLRA